MIKKIFITMILVFSISPLFAADNSDWTAGQTQGTSTLNYFKSNMSGTINTPMTTDQKLTTVDGSKNGDAKLMCSGSTAKEFLTISYTGTSDINILVQMDKNLDGTKETSWSYSGISGICSNGAVICSSGSWSNCKYYTWTNTSGTLSLSQTPSSQVGGCYCINSSCGGLAATNNKSILNDIAGGIAPLMTDSTQYVITKTENTGQSVKYWGQNYSNCSNSNGNRANVSLDGSNIQSQTDSAVLNQSQNNTSAYYVLNQGSGNSTTLDSNYKTDLTNRSTTVRASSSNANGTNNYSYTDKLSGSSVNINGSLLLGSQGKAKYCEVEWSQNNTDAFQDDTNRKNSTSNNQMKYNEIRECTNNWSVCPVNNGESIKNQCGAIDNFAEVAGALNAVSEATKDMVCSSTN